MSISRPGSQSNKVMSFSAYLAPDGEVYVSSAREAAIARRIARWEQELSPGGMVVVSTDVNISGSSLKSKAKSIMRTWYNRLMRTRKVDEALKKELKKKGLETGWSVGNLFKGRYYSPKSKQVFDEKSFAVDIRGVPFSFVKDAAESIAKTFKQESVLVVDYEKNRTFLIGP